MVPVYRTRWVCCRSTSSPDLSRHSCIQRSSAMSTSNRHQQRTFTDAQRVRRSERRRINYAKQQSATKERRCVGSFVCVSSICSLAFFLGCSFRFKSQLVFLAVASCLPFPLFLRVCSLHTVCVHIPAASWNVPHSIRLSTQ